MLKTHVLAHSAAERPIQAFELENAPPTILVIGGMHGDEPQSAFVATCLVDLLNTPVAKMMDEHILIVPRLNPDGLERATRRNGNGVDINRNFPAANWKKLEPGDPYYGGPMASSEPETKLILELFSRHGPRRILAIHCIDGDRQCVNYDGPGAQLAKVMADENKYDVREHIGHPTPGSLGTWAGYERQIPTVTLELSSTCPEERCWHENRDAILAFIQADFD